jgi:hypothetical protein
MPTFDAQPFPMGSGAVPQYDPNIAQIFQQLSECTAQLNQLKQLVSQLIQQQSVIEEVLSTTREMAAQLLGSDSLT